jgi:hypothetical protein
MITIKFSYKYFALSVKSLIFAKRWPWLCLEGTPPLTAWCLSYRHDESVGRRLHIPMGGYAIQTSSLNNEKV